MCELIVHGRTASTTTCLWHTASIRDLRNVWDRLWPCGFWANSCLLELMKFGNCSPIRSRFWYPINTGRESRQSWEDECNKKGGRTQNTVSDHCSSGPSHEHLPGSTWNCTDHSLTLGKCHKAEVRHLDHTKDLSIYIHFISCYVSSSTAY